MQTILVLDNIRSAHNVGSIFRTADAAGISKIILVGTTPDPIDRFGRAEPQIAKTALGAQLSIPWEHADTTLEVFAKHPEHFKIALEQSANSVDYKSVLPREKNLIVLGPEVTGLPEEILHACDAIAEIPMNGEKESLNVSVAAGIFFFKFLGI